jgi:hypothetical protein
MWCLTPAAGFRADNALSGQDALPRIVSGLPTIVSELGQCWPVLARLSLVVSVLAVSAMLPKPRYGRLGIAFRRILRMWSRAVRMVGLPFAISGLIAVYG